MFRPTLALELRTFKATFRKVVRHHLPEEHHDLFQPPTTQADKRLRDLGVNVHTAAIRGIINTSLDHRRHQPIEQALLKQRTATSAKKLKALLGTNSTNNNAKLAGTETLDRIKITMIQIDYKSQCRWSRPHRYYYPYYFVYVSTTHLYPVQRSY